jgi:SpoIID/LytB domain protein
MSARRILFLAAAVVVVAALPATPATGAPSRLRVSAPEGGSLLVHGEYPPVQSSCVDPYQPVIHARYRGTIEVVRRDDGSLSLIGELAFEDYVKGIAEVPRDWPMEALKAQVVAARTYALNRLRNADPGGDYDLCATTSCQVYVGMEVEAGPWGNRWIRAVDQTSGQVLLYQGEPAITYYSSTSPGRTFDVEDVFGGAALPYLRGREEEDDGASPLSRWRVEVPFDDLARFLTADGVWAGGRIRSVRVSGGRIRVIGADAVTVSKASLRDALNDWAGCLMPDSYPTTEPDGYQLPQTVPSVWFRAAEEGRSLVLAGRGWGHGIGMVQWGAYGKARRDLGYGDILASYYGGLRPQPVQLPGTIRILIAEGLRRITVDPSGTAAAGPSVAARPPWTITGGARLRIRHGRSPGPVLELTEARLPSEVIPGGPYPVRVTASDDVEVSAAFLAGGAGGAVAARTGSRPLEEGSGRVRLTAPALPPGTYAVELTVSNGVDSVTATNDQVVTTPTSTPPSPSPPAPTGTEAARPAPAPDRGGPGVWIAAGTVAALLVALLVLTALRRKGLHRP